MDAEKLRNLTDGELLHQQQELNDQLFRLKFQLKMGQTESLNKIRGLRKDVARIKTLMREKVLGVTHKTSVAKPAARAAAPETAKAAAVAEKAPAKAKAKPAAKAKAAKPAAKARKK
jgi:large subunit ribosomal protein L29